MRTHTARIFATLSITLLSAATLFAQGKGVDSQRETVRDTGTRSMPANNGSKQDVGAGRGFDFGRGRTPAATLLPNPLRAASRIDVLRKSIEELMRERKLILDAAASRPDAGIYVSQPFTFSKGSIVTDSELNRVADFAADANQNFTRGRYTLRVEMQPIDSASANVGVSARIEGRGESVSGPEWVTLPSSGVVEQEFLLALQNKLSDAPLTLPAPRP